MQLEAGQTQTSKKGNWGQEGWPTRPQLTREVHLPSEQRSQDSSYTLWCVHHDGEI